MCRVCVRREGGPGMRERTEWEGTPIVAVWVGESRREVFMKRCSRWETSRGVGMLDRGFGSRFSSKRFERIMDALWRLMSINTTDLTALTINQILRGERELVVQCYV